jgi:guanylate kinase
MGVVFLQNYKFEKANSQKQKMEKVIIFSAPSGSGKTTIVHQLLKKYPQFEFSISATSRAPRGQEVDGVDYYFLTEEEFLRRIDEDAFVEWEAVYAGTHYGTLRSEVDRIWGKGNIIIFDVDVVGGVNLKKIFGSKACSVFIMPPSVEELERRLIGRATDAPEVIAKRVAKAAQEIERAPEFDHIVVNDVLEEAIAATCAIIDKFIAE